MTINRVKIKRSKEHSIGRQLNLIPRSFSASPIFERKSPGTRLVLTYAVKGTGMRRSHTRQSQSPSDKDGGLTAPTWLVPTCLRRASTSVRTYVVWCHSPRASRDDWVSALTTTPTTPWSCFTALEQGCETQGHISGELCHSTRTGVWNTGAHIRGVVSQHSDTRVKNKGTFKGSCFAALEHACEYQGTNSKTVSPSLCYSSNSVDRLLSSTRWSPKFTFSGQNKSLTLIILAVPSRSAVCLVTQGHVWDFHQLYMSGKSRLPLSLARSK